MIGLWGHDVRGGDGGDGDDERDQSEEDPNHLKPQIDIESHVTLEGAEREEKSGSSKSECKHEPTSEPEEGIGEQGDESEGSENEGSGSDWRGPNMLFPNPNPSLSPEREDELFSDPSLFQVEDTEQAQDDDETVADDHTEVDMDMEDWIPLFAMRSDVQVYS